MANENRGFRPLATLGHYDTIGSGVRAGGLISSVASGSGLIGSSLNNPLGGTTPILHRH